MFCFVLFGFFFNYASISDSLNGSAHIGTEISQQRRHIFEFIPYIISHNLTIIVKVKEALAEKKNMAAYGGLWTRQCLQREL